jgi:hypothetical protein
VAILEKFLTITGLRFEWPAWTDASRGVQAPSLTDNTAKEVFKLIFKVQSPARHEQLSRRSPYELQTMYETQDFSKIIHDFVQLDKLALMQNTYVAAPGGQRQAPVSRAMGLTAAPAEPVSQALVMGLPGDATKECWGCGETGHQKRNCPTHKDDMPTARQRAVKFSSCNYCGAEGHVQDECNKHKAYTQK